MKRTVIASPYNRRVHFVDDMDEAVALTENLRTPFQREWYEAPEDQDPDFPSRGFSDVAGRAVVMCVADGNLGTVVHEADHAAWYVLDLAGVTLTADNHEAHAYLTDWLFTEWLSRMGGLQKYRLKPKP